MEEILKKCALFRDMSEQQIHSVLQKYPHTTKDFSEKDFVILQNDICNKLMIVTEGLLQAQMVDSSGKQIIIDELGVNDILAPAFIFPDINRMPVSVYVLEAAQVLYFQRSVLLEMMQENQGILTNFLTIISNRSRFLSEKLMFHVFMSLKVKVANYLLEECALKQSSHLRMQYTQQELADRFGVARPSLARVFSELEKENILEIRNKDITIKNMQALKDCVI